MDNGVQKLFEHLLGGPESSGVLYHEGQKKNHSAANSDGCEDPDVEHWVFVGRRKVEIFGDERHVGVR